MNTARPFIAIIVSIGLLAGFHVRANAAAKTLAGSVLPDYQADLPDWAFEVSGELQEGGLLPGSPRTSLGELYVFQANEDTTVSFIFTKPFYRSKRSSWINVTAGLSDQYRVNPNVTLHRINTNTGSAFLTPRANESVFRTVSFKASESEAFLQSREDLRKELQEQAELARASKTAEVFQFNLEVYADLYRDSEALRSEVVQIKADDRFKDVTTVPVERAALYKKIVQRERGENVDIDPDALNKLANDSAVVPTVRIESVRAMRVGRTIGSVQDKPTLDLLRKNASDPSSRLYMSSLIQLLKIGEPKDRSEIVKGLQGKDVQRAVSVVNAIEGARFKEGRDEVMKLADRSDVQPIVKEYASQSATRFRQIEASPTNSPPDEKSQGKKVRPQSTGKVPIKSNIPIAITREMIVSDEFESVSGDFTLSRDAEGTTHIRINFRSLGMTKRRYYVLWAVTPEKRIVRLGMISVRSSTPASIEAKTSLTQFGLYITAEASDTGQQPTGPIVSTLKGS
jgi:hypothetical protein